MRPMRRSPFSAMAPSAGRRIISMVPRQYYRDSRMKRRATLVGTSMSVASDHGLWQRAVERGLITGEQLQQCLADQRHLREAGEEAGIDQLLLKRGWID